MQGDKPQLLISLKNALDNSYNTVLKTQTIKRFWLECSIKIIPAHINRAKECILVIRHSKV